MSSEELLFPKPPYNFAWSAMFFGRFKNDVVDVWIPPAYNSTGYYYRYLEISDNPCLVKVTQEGKTDNPSLRIHILKGSTCEQLRDIIARIFRADDDLNGFYRTAEKDHTMSHLAKRFYGLKPTQTPTVFEMIIVAISEQQVSLPTAITLRSRLAHRFGKSVEYEGRRYCSFPSAKVLATANVNELRALSFPRHKSRSIINVARMQTSGKFDFESLYYMSNEEATEFLSEIPGLGPWSVQYVLARGLGRLDVYPKNDLSVRRAVSYFYGSGDIMNSSEVERVLSRWHPFERYAEYYLLIAYELEPMSSKSIRGSAFHAKDRKTTAVYSMTR